MHRISRSACALGLILGCTPILTGCGTSSSDPSRRHSEESFVQWEYARLQWAEGTLYQSEFWNWYESGHNVEANSFDELVTKLTPDRKFRFAIEIADWAGERGWELVDYEGGAQSIKYWIFKRVKQ